MNNSTQDSQEFIEGLGKAGGGLSSGRAFFLRHVGFPFLNSIVSWDRALDIFEISIELAIRFCELVIRESKYEQLNTDIKNLKRIAGIE